jgi:CheY-like chemotaxis protein/HPt (histidine-containing phosphotransfer) domain-containing protein
LAEDVEVNQFVVTETLGRSGYACKIANNGREAVALATAEPFDIILMDCQMPEMSGFEATTAIRAFEKSRGLSRVKIIALTANAVKGDRERCLTAGMDDYLTKPLNPVKLIQCIEASSPAGAAVAVQAEAKIPIHDDGSEVRGRTGSDGEESGSSEYLRTGVTEKAELTPNERSVAPESDDSAINAAELLARCDGDRQMMSKLIQIFQTKSHQTWVGLLASYESGDGAGTARLAHALKGSAANLSAVKVSSLAARLEELGRSADLSAAESVIAQLGAELQRCHAEFATLAGPEAPKGSSTASAGMLSDAVR